MTAQPLVASWPLSRSTAWLARARWIEGELFEILGRWSCDGSDPDDVAVAFAVESRVRAQRAADWERCLPRLSSVVPTGTDDDDGGRPREVVAALAAAASTGERLVAIYGVALPTLVEAYEARLSAAAPVADGPVIRVARGAIAEDQSSLVDGRSRLRAAAAPGTPAADAVARFRGALERGLSDAGGWFGRA